MHVIILLVVLVVLAFDSGVQPFGAAGAFDAPWLGAALALATPPAFLLLSIWAARTSRDGRHTARSIRRVDRIVRLGPWCVVTVHALAIFGLGWLTAVRSLVGDVVLLDEVVAMLPPLLAIVAIWVGTWPVERLIREWAMVRSPEESDDDPLGPSDEPLAVSGWHGGRPRLVSHLRHQIRSQMLLVLIPILIAVGTAEWGRLAIDRWAPQFAERASPWVSVVAVVFALLVTPSLVRAALGLRPLPAGDLRDALLDVCRRHGVRVREVLVWSTGNTMLNGAVLGLVGPLRHVLLTDALLRRLPRPMLLAVMAHEIGHIRRHHLPWLAATALAALWLASVSAWLVALASLSAVAAASRSVGLEFGDESMSEADWLIGLEIAIGLAVALMLIGWVSRRFEWQADAFAATDLTAVEALQSVPAASCPPPPDDPHLDQPDSAASRSAPAKPAPRPVIEARSVVGPTVRQDGVGSVSKSAVETVCATLEAVTIASGGDPTARSWRHGSIRRRQRQLRLLTDQPIDRLPIDRTVLRLKSAVAAIVVLAIASFFAPWIFDAGLDDSTTATPPDRLDASG